MLCHVAVVFPGHPPLHYQAEEVTADAFAKRLLGHAKVTIDQKLSGVTRRLPCERLWLL